MQRGTVHASSGLHAVRCGLAAGVVADVQAGMLNCCCPGHISAEGSAQLCRGLLASTGAEQPPLGGSCAPISSGEADKTGANLKACSTGQDLHGQHPLLGFQL